MPINTLKQAEIHLSNEQMLAIGGLAGGPGARKGCWIEETNLNNVVAVVTKPGLRTHLIDHGGKVTDMGIAKQER